MRRERIMKNEIKNNLGYVLRVPVVLFINAASVVGFFALALYAMKLWIKSDFIEALQNGTALKFINTHTVPFVVTCLVATLLAILGTVIAVFVLNKYRATRDIQNIKFGSYVSKDVTCVQVYAASLCTAKEPAEKQPEDVAFNEKRTRDVIPFGGWCSKVALVVTGLCVFGMGVALEASLLGCIMLIGRLTEHDLLTALHSCVDGKSIEPLSTMFKNDTVATVCMVVASALALFIGLFFIIQGTKAVYHASNPNKRHDKQGPIVAYVCNLLSEPQVQRPYQQHAFI